MAEFKLKNLVIGVVLMQLVIVLGILLVINVFTKVPAVLTPADGSLQKYNTFLQDFNKSSQILSNANHYENLTNSFDSPSPLDFLNGMFQGGFTFLKFTYSTGKLGISMILNAPKIFGNQLIPDVVPVFIAAIILIAIGFAIVSAILNRDL